MEEEKVISAEDYKKKFSKAKVVKLKSGAVFKIRPISPLDYLNDRIKSDNTAESGKKFVKSLLLTCVLEPKIVEKDIPGVNELLLDDLLFEDYLSLSKEITDYSTSGNAGFLETGQSSSTSTG